MNKILLLFTAVYCSLYTKLKEIVFSFLQLRNQDNLSDNTGYENTSSLRTLVFSMVLLFVVSFANAATFVSVTSGNWNSAATWNRTSGSDGDGIPDANDIVNIANGHTITVTADAACTSITFTGAAAGLTVNSGFSLAITGALTLSSLVSNDAAAVISGVGTLSCASISVGNDITPTLSKTTIMTSTISNFNISGNIGIYSNRNGGNFNNTTFNLESGTVNVNGQITTTNENGSNTSTFSMASGVQTGTLFLGNATSFVPSGTGNSTINLNGTGSTVNYDRAGNQTVYTTTYNGLIISNSGTKTASGTFTVSKDFTIWGGTFALNNATSYSLTVLGNYNQTGGIFDFNIGTSGTSNFYLSGNFSNTTGVVDSMLTSGNNAPNGIITFSGTGIQTLNIPTVQSVTWVKYIVNPSSEVKLTSDIILTSADLATQAAYTGDFIVNGIIDFDIYKIYQSGGVTGSGVFTLNAGATLKTKNANGVDGSVSSTNITRTFSPGANYNFNGTVAQSTSAGMPATVNSLTLSNTSGVTLTKATAVTTNFSIGSGTVANLGTFTHSANTLTLGSFVTSSGSWGSTSSPATNQNNTFFAATNGIVSITTTTCTTGNWTGVTSSDWNTASNWCGAIPTATTDVVIPSGTPFSPNIASGTTALCRNLTVNASATLTLANSATSLLNISGNFVNSGTFSAGAASTTSFVGTANQSIGGFTILGNVSMLKTAGIATFTGAVNGGALTINGTGGTLNLGAALTHTFTGDITLTAGTLNGGSSTLNANATTATAWNGTGTNFTAGTSTVNFGGVNQTIGTATTFNNLTFSGSGTKTLNAAITVTNLAVNTGVTATNNSVLTVSTALSGVGALTNASPGTTTLTISGSCSITTLTNAGTTNINGSGTISTAAANFVNTGTLNLGGSGTITGITNSTGGTIHLVNSGNIGTLNNATATSLLNINATTVPTIATLTATVAGNTVNYNGAGQTVIATTYSNLRLSGSGTKTFAGVTTINNGLIIDSGIVASLGTNNHTALTLSLNGNGQNSGSWGSSASAATYKNATYFGATGSGLLNVTNFSCTAGTWIGATSTDWNTASNWCGGIPTASTDVVIPTGTPNQPTIASGTTATCRNITINASATLALANSATSLLNISGNFTNSGTFTAGTASVISFVGVNQAVAGVTYSNLTLSGSGTKTFTANTVISNFMSVSSGVVVSLNGITTHTTATLLLNGVNQIGGTWGGTGSGATNINTTFFTGTGRITVPNNSVIDNDFASYGATGDVAGTIGEYGGAFTLNAPVGSVLMNVKFASYGTPTGISPNFVISSCHAIGSKTNTISLLGNTTWSFNATSGVLNGIFGDPCVGTSKTYSVVATYSQPICADTSPGAITINGSNPTGGNGIYTYLWEISTTSAISGYATASGTSDGRDYLVPAGISQTTWYRRTTTSGAYTSNTIVIIQVNKLPSLSTPTVATISGTTTICAGASTTLTVSGGSLSGYAAAGDKGGYAEWFTGSCGATSIGTGNSITVTPASTTTYYVRYTNSCGNTATCLSQVVTVSPNASIASVTGTSPLCIAGTATYTANTVVLSGGTGAWSSSNTAVATVSAAGLVTGVSAGSANIIYTITGGCGGTKSAQQTVTVSPNASIASVTGTSSLCIAGTATYAANTVVLSGGTGVWSSSNTAVATVSAAGLVTGVSAGSANIIYTITGGCGGTKSAQQTVTVSPNASIASVTGTSSLCIAGTATYTANTVVLSGGTGAWSSSNTAVATVSAAGLVTGVSAGSANIIYTITGGCGGTKSAQQSVTVSPNASIASVTGTSPLCIAGTATYAANTVVLGGGTGVWSSSNTAVATVSAAGLVTGVSAGSANIIYTITGGCGGTKSAQQTVTVSPNASIASVTGTSSLCIAGTATYVANTVVLSGGTGAWSSSNTAVATVSAAGLVTGVSAGSANIIYTITGGCGGTVSTQQTVTVSPNASIASVTGTSPLCIAGTATYVANTVVLSGGTGVWSSSNTAVATVSVAGLVTGVSAGSANIIYTITGGCGGTKSAQQTVTVSPNASIASVTGTSSLCIVGTATYAANTVVLSGGTGAWSSSNTAVATVSVAGMVTGVSAGSANIIYTITGGCGGTVSAQQSVTVSPNASIASVTGTSPLCIAGTATYAANTVVLGGGTGVWSSSNTAVATVSAAGLVTGVSAGSANIIYTITGGCGGTKSAQQTVTVSPNASIASVTGTSSLCIAGTATYAANTVVLSGGTGAWSSSNTAVATVSAAGLVTGVSAGSANIIYTITGGCGGTVSTQQSVTVSPNASIVSVTGTSPLCIAGTATYTANTVVLSGGTGAWSSSNTAVATVSAAGLVTGVSAGSANIIYTITGGCGGTKSAQQSVLVNATPDAPVLNNVVLTCNQTTANGTWAAVPNISNYRFDVSLDPLFGSFIPGYQDILVAPSLNPTESVAVNGLTPGVTYYARARTISSCGTSVNSNTATLSVPITTTTDGGLTWDNFSPDSTKKAVYAVGSASSVTMVTPINACSVQINPGVNVIVGTPGNANTNAVLHIENGLTVDATSTLTFENNASLIQVNDVAVNSGLITYKRITTPMKNFDFTDWSSPVLGQTLKKLSPNTLSDKYYSFWDRVWITENSATAMSPGKGYTIRTPKEGVWGAPYPETVVFPYAQPVSFIGKPNNGVYTVTVNSNAGRYNFIGNPYPSALDADVFVPDNAAAIKGTIYIWTHNTPITQSGSNYVYSQDDYAAYNAFLGAGVAAASSTIPGANTNEPTGKVASGQGFFTISTTGTTGSVTFNNNMRVGAAASNSQFFKGTKTKKSTIERHRIWLSLSNIQGAFKQTLIGYATGATNGDDIAFDGSNYTKNAYIDFYSLISTKKCVIQGRALPFDKKDEVPLGYKSTIDGSFSISIDKIDGVLASQDVFLQDKTASVYYNLKKGPYTFNTLKGTFDDRFVLVYVDKLAVVVPPVVVEPPVVVTPPVVVVPPIVIEPPVVVVPPVVVTPPVVVEPPVVVVPPVVVTPPVVVEPPVVVVPPVVVTPPVVLEPPVVVVPPVVVTPPVVVEPPVVVDPPVVVEPPVVVTPPVVVVPPVVVDPPVVVTPPVVVDPPIVIPPVVVLDPTLENPEYNKTGKAVVVSVNNHQIKINSFDETISKVMVYDLTGRLLFENENINKNEYLIQNLNSSDQFLIVITQLVNGKWVTKEIVF